MSTRATVWIRNEKKDTNIFLYHHCDGYCLDEDVDPALKKLTDEDWNEDKVGEVILSLEFGDTYKIVDGVGWDSEYVYKISIDERKMYKYATGIGNPDGEENFESRLTNLEATFEYAEHKEDMKWELDKKTMAQVLLIQIREIIKYGCKWLNAPHIPNDEIERIQKLYKILNEKKEDETD